MHAEYNDEAGVDEADERSEREHGEHHGNNAIRIVVDQSRCQARSEADQRSDGQINAAGENGQRLPDTYQREIGGLLEDVQEIVEAQEAVRYGPADCADGADQYKHCCKPAVVAQPRWHVHANADSLCHAAASLVARCMTFCSVASTPASSPVTRPSRMTMTRSAMPITSVSSELIIRIATPPSARLRIMR